MLDIADFQDLFHVFITSPLSISLIIIASSLVLEDLATASAALAAAKGIIPIEWALGSLIFGIIIGDLLLYGLGHFSARYEWIKKRIEGRRVQKVQSFLGKSVIGSTLLARFMPGMRFPTYTAMGLFNLNFKLFAVTVVFGVGAWSAFVFSLIYTLGEMALDMVGIYQWIAVALVIVLAFALPYVAGLVVTKLAGARNEIHGE